MNIENKTQIKNRMIKKAADLWGVTPNEIESSFDPVVSLLISACSSEMAKISNQINNSETRVTERLIQLMTPESLYGVKPAHGIAYAEPTSPNGLIKPENLFYFKKKISDPQTGEKVKNIFFSPVHENKLIDARITHLVCGKEGYELDGKSKATIFTLKENSSLPPSTLYLGIKTSDQKIALNDISIFFESLNLIDKEIFYHNLKQAQFYYKDAPLEVSPGFINSLEFEKNELKSIFSNKPKKTQTIENYIENTYKKYFMTLRSDVSLEDPLKVPVEFADLIDLKTHSDFQELHWIKIVFPRIINNTILNGLFCSFNAFPVLNRKIESITYQLKDYIHIIPLSTMDLFLDIKEVNNTSGMSYKFRENDTEKDQKGTFIIRRDNTSKLDSRKAKEYLLHLIELLKDESAAFSIYGNDFLQSSLRELNQNIATLENKLKDMTRNVAEMNYISIKPYAKKDTLMIKYWTTNGEEANHIKSGSALAVYKGSELKQKNSFFLTPTFQGKNNLSMEERLYTYRSALLSRQRIVSKEDVKALCFELCGSKIQKVEIQKSFKTAIDVNKGLIPAIEILIYPKRTDNTSETEWDFLKTNILSILEKRSLNVFPYYVMIMNELKTDSK
ncbi:type VI secretion system baseplate subunit TssF [Ascidiimonas sp. W6]|uniref:type VI secretion system baseplate subunit TssF n=1 Tax=Ascidiimonas meishanensis TaxID=3128903 RepID=UPI0030ED8CF6